MMNTKEFLNTVLGDQGHYCALGLRPKDKKKVQKFYSSIGALADAALNLDAEGYDSYFALGSFLDDKSRTAENVNLIKCFFLDLDCGVDKPYKEQTDALKALHNFCSATKMPRPTLVVNSGRGVHVYWVLDKSCPKEQWLSVADKLKLVCAENNLDADVAVTSDAARVLRVPRTHNYKSTPPMPVRVIGALGNTLTLEEFEEALPETSSIPVISKRSYSAEDLETSKRLMGNTRTKSFTTIVKKTLAGKGCGQIHKAIVQPNDLSYGEWLSVLSIAKHCEEERAVHMISQGYDAYDAQETEKIAASINSPHLCVTFADHNPAGCEGCPHRGKIKTPITLGMELKEATEADNIIDIPVETSEEAAPVHTVAPDSGLFANSGDEAEPVLVPRTMKYAIPQYPDTYSRQEGGGIIKITHDKDGNTDKTLIYKRDLYLTKRINDPIEGPRYQFKHHTAREGIRTFIITGVKLSSRDEFRKAMGMNDIHLLKPEPLMAYVAAWIEKLLIDDDVLDAKMQFGWTADMKSFVVGGREIFKDKIIENPPSSNTEMYFPIFKKKGTLEGWKEVAQFYNMPGNEQHQFMMATGFGSPLLSFLPNVSGMINHLFSSATGIGKSMGMIGGASIWGNYASYILSGASTANSIWMRAEIWKNLPLYVDEITNLNGKEASDAAYAVSSGQQKSRMDSSGQNKERFRGDPWKLITGTNGNTGLVEKMSSYKAQPKGEQQRIIETRAKQVFFTSEDTEITNKINKAVDKNYGLAGDVYMQHVLSNMERAEELCWEYRGLIIKKAGLTDQNRLWSGGAAVCIAGVVLAKEAGLVDWDLDKLIDWIVERLKFLKISERELNLDVQQLINDYYAHYQGAIMRLKSTDDARGGDPSGVGTLVYPEKMPHYSWVGRYETDVNRLYLLIKPFKEWCIEQQYNYAEVFDGLQQTFGAVKDRIRLGKGTTINMPPTYVIAMKFEEPTLPQDDPEGNVFDEQNTAD